MGFELGGENWMGGCGVVNAEHPDDAGSMQRDAGGWWGNMENMGDSS